MLTNSKKMFWQALICSTFISTSTLIMSSNAYAETAQEEKSAEVNQQLLMPNEAVDDMTDINRARRYYQARESRNEAQTEETAGEEKMVPVASVRFRTAGKAYYFDSRPMKLTNSSLWLKIKMLRLKILIT